MMDDYYWDLLCDCSAYSHTRKERINIWGIANLPIFHNILSLSGKQESQIVTEFYFNLTITIKIWVPQNHYNKKSICTFFFHGVREKLIPS